MYLPFDVIHSVWRAFRLLVQADENLRESIDDATLFKVLTKLLLLRLRGLLERIWRRERSFEVVVWEPQRTGIEKIRGTEDNDMAEEIADADWSNQRRPRRSQGLILHHKSNHSVRK